MTDERALFERDGAHLVPTMMARGPWRPDALHGAAVAALLAGALEIPARTLTRICVDLVASVPFAPLTLEVADADGGRRVGRRTVALLAGGVVVARAQGVAIRETHLDLPPATSEVPNPFAGVPVPDLSSPRQGIVEQVGWEGFDSTAVSLAYLRGDARPAHTVCQYVNLLVPVVAGEPISAVSRAAVAADFGSSHTYRRLPFADWTFMNADLTVSLVRPPADGWVGLACTSLAGAHGAGITMATLADEHGVLGQSSQSLLVEARELQRA